MVKRNYVCRVCFKEFSLRTIGRGHPACPECHSVYTVKIPMGMTAEEVLAEHGPACGWAARERKPKPKESYDSIIKEMDAANRCNNY